MERIEDKMETEKTSKIITIQVRYCFEDEDSHSMDAEVFNECEKQFIKAIKSVEKYLSTTLSINIKPREEGSLFDVFTIDIVKSVVGWVVDVLISAVVTYFFTLKTSKDINRILKILENNQILELKKGIKNGTLTDDDINNIVNNDKDLLKSKSKFFKAAQKEQKLTQVETEVITDDALPPSINRVERKDFYLFTLPEIIETVEDIRQAKIYIVAPILIGGKKYSWKGICENNSIDFQVTDRDFLEQVWNQLVTFTNGTFINCELKTVKKINIETEETKFSKKVVKVINCGDDNNPVMPIVHKRKTTNNDSSEQLSLFDDLGVESEE